MSPSKKMLAKTLHVVLRIGEFVQYDDKRRSITDLHNDVVQRVGRVAVGKFGRQLLAAKVSALQEQIARKLGNRLYLLFKSDGRFSAVSARLDSIAVGEIVSELVPNYYESVTASHGLELDTSQATWFVVNEKFSAANIGQLKLALSGRPMLEVVSECRTAVLFATK